MSSKYSRLFFTLLLAAAALAAPPDKDTQPQAKDRPLRVLSYNIHHGAGNAQCTQVPGQPECALDLDQIVKVLRASDADVIGLQEVDRMWARSAVVDQPAYLAQALGMFVCYGANLDHQPDNHSSVPHQYGTAILSRMPILECANTHLPRATAGSEQRGLLMALINVRGVPLHFYNTHLHTRHADRVVQVQEIVKLIGTPTDPVVLVGDLNATPTESSMPPLYTILRDAWGLAGSGFGYTYPANLTGNPNRRIDYIFVSPDIAVSDIEVLIDADTRLAADHYPLAADLALPGSQVGIGRNP